MSMLKIPIPTIEDIVQANAYEARMHFLNPNGSMFGGYQTLPGQVSKPTAEAAQEELPFDQHRGLLMWVDFFDPEVTGTVDSKYGKRLTTKRSKIGELTLATYPGRLQPYNEVLDSNYELNSFTKLWLGTFAMNRSRNFFGEYHHPLQDIHGLYKRANIEQELENVQKRAERERWDSRIDSKQWYVASLARLAMKEFPELFTGKKPWHKQLGLRLRHRSLPAKK